MGEYDLAIAIGTILSGLAGISIAIWAVIAALSAKSQADSAKSLSKTSIFQAEASKIQAELTLTQVKLQHEEFNQKMRPWIGMLGYKKDATGKIIFKYTNHGQIPPEKMKIKILTSNGKITQEILENTEVENRSYIGIIFPKQEKIFRTDIPLDIIQKIDEKKEKMFIGVLIEYNYSGDSVGKTGSIVDYQGNNHFVITTEFVE